MTARAFSRTERVLGLSNGDVHDRAGGERGAAVGVQQRGTQPYTPAMYMYSTFPYSTFLIV